jgi:hypothetical protein
MKNLELEGFGVVEMRNEESILLSGGDWPNWIKGLSVAYVAEQVVEHWSEIKTGFVNGWNSLDGK